jgi:3-dehydroquinate synthase
MVDSSVGGKTAVNLSSGKNQAGAFYQPDVVVCDTETLNSLPSQGFRDGCAEMIKHGLILSGELFELLKEPLQPQMEDIIARNVTIKRDIVAQDEKDTGIRQLLNFGHTIAHGIEKHSGYSVTHGSAVAAGMAIAGRGAWRMGFCGEDCYLEIVEMLKRFHLPYETGIPPERLTEAAFSDKKRSGRRITEVLPEKVGKCVLHSFSMDELDAFIRLGLG